jgi:hypothetical protein
MRDKLTKPTVGCSAGRNQILKANKTTRTAKQGAPKTFPLTRGSTLPTGCSRPTLAKDQQLLALKLERWLKDMEAFLTMQQIIKDPSKQTTTLSFRSGNYLHLK